MKIPWGHRSDVLCRLSTAAVAMAIAGQAGAQTTAAGSSTQPAPSQSVPPAADTSQLQDIVVTANKRSENLQHAAIAATVVTGADLVSAGISDVTNLEKIAPSVKLTFVRQQAQVYIRGIGSALTSSNADPAVAVNINGVYIPSEMTAAGFFDLDRVEVLPGPQGTIYGRNAAGGVINTVTKRPGHDFTVEGYGEYGNYNALNLFGGVDLPVTGTLSLRFVGKLDRSDPYIKGLNGSGLGSTDTRAGRLSLLWTPTPDTTIFVTVARNKQTGTNPGNVNNPPVNGDYYYTPFDTRALGLFDDYRTDIVTGQVDQKLSDHFSLTYLGGYTNLKGNQNILAFNGGPATVSNVIRVNSQSNELRLNGDFDRLKSLVGVYQYTQYAYNAQRVALPAPILLAGPFDQHAHGYAAFGQLTFSLLDTLRLIGGLRYSNDTKRIAGTSGTLLPTGVVVGAFSYANADNKDRVDYKAGVEFDASASSLLYASVQSGYNEFGFSTAAPNSASQTAVPYQTATLTAYTLGTKNRFAGNRLQLNLEGFYYDYKNYQVSARNLATSQNQIYNAQKATTYGVQLDAKALVTKADKLDLSVGYLHAKADTLIISPTANFSGFTLPFSPTWTVIGSYSHTVDLANGAAIEALGSVRYIDGIYTSYNHVPGTFQSANAKVDANLTYRAASGRWSATAFVRNLTNRATFGQLNGGANPGPAAGLVDPPRTYGVRVGFNL